LTQLASNPFSKWPIYTKHPARHLLGQHEHERFRRLMEWTLLGQSGSTFHHIPLMQEDDADAAPDIGLVAEMPRQCTDRNY